MNDTLRVLILAVVQGITEFLPISSDGHLVISNQLLKRWQGRTQPEEALTLILTLHAGTLGSIAIVYFHRLRHHSFHPSNFQMYEIRNCADILNYLVCPQL